ncbi:MAG TPA: A24 family peptidase [Gammaproteobacteria bacterium]|nr:A24 family peptidase [Gammaproteobacteria bacterium]
MEIFEAWPVVLFIVAAVLGLVVGSFLNVVAYRVPIMLERAWRAQCEDSRAEPPPPQVAATSDRFDLWWPRSACPACRAPIRAHHNVPVLGFVWLKGRCASCGAKISPRYPIVEALAAVLAITVAAAFGPTPQAVAALGFTWTLLALTLIDLDRQLLPDSMTLPLLWAGLLVNALDGGAGLFASLHSSVVGAAAGYLALWSVYHLFKLVTGKEGMGYGDFKLLAAIGAWLGWQLLPVVILLSAAVGSVVGIGLIVFRGRSSQVPIPFGPYLAAAGWITLLWGPRLVEIYESWAFPLR